MQIRRFVAHRGFSIEKLQKSVRLEIKILFFFPSDECNTLKNITMLQRLCISFAGRRTSVLTRSRASASKSVFGIKNKSASKASTVFLVNKVEIFNTKRTVTHWEDEELPGTSREPRVIEFNNRLREQFEKGNYQVVEDLIKDAHNKGLPLDIQTYALHAKMIKAQHEEKFKSVPLRKRVPELTNVSYSRIFIIIMQYLGVHHQKLLILTNLIFVDINHNCNAVFCHYKMVHNYNRDRNTFYR